MKKVIHIDMDCFYAAVETKHNPRLLGKPVGVGGPPDSRSVLCTANYEARKYGVRSAMPSSQAMRLCPNLILVPPHFDLYKTESQKVRHILEKFTDKIEPLSLDEAYLDVSQCSQFQGSATRMAQAIQQQIQLETGLTASAGVGPNKFLAKIASDWKKPNGLFVIRPQDIEQFMLQLPVNKLFGVGKVTAGKLHAMGIYHCHQLQKLSDFELRKIFGAQYLHYKMMSRGQDEREVLTHWERKSISVEETFNRDLTTLEEVLKAVPDLYREWKKRVESGSFQDRIRGAVVKIKTADFQSSTLEMGVTEFPSELIFDNLFRKIYSRFHQPLRLLGLGARLNSSEKSTEGQLSFFPESAESASSSLFLNYHFN